MQALAEGVSTEQEAQLLAAWGCAEARGAIAQPLTAQGIEPLPRAGKIVKSYVSAAS